MKNRASPAEIDIRNIQEAKNVDIGFIRNVVEKTLKSEAIIGEVSILLVDNNYIKDLNRKYRSADRVTDVLAFPMEDEEILGDVVVSVEKADEQAKDYKQSFNTELARLLVHGLLHLLGYSDRGQDRKRMFDRQETILKEVLRCT